jgi:hypothetical protein
MTLASEICPASSTNRTSTAPAILADAHSHDVPRPGSPDRRRAELGHQRRPCRGRRARQRAPCSLSPFWTGRTVTPSTLAALKTAVSKVADDLMAGSSDADSLPCGEERADHPCTGICLARTGAGLGWRGSCSPRQGRADVLRRGLTRRAGRAPRPAIARLGAAGRIAGRGLHGSDRPPRSRGRRPTRRGRTATTGDPWS